MKKFFLLFVIVVIFLALYPFVFTDKKSHTSVQGLPWQIKVLADGSTSVFGIQPGKSTFADVIATLGDDVKLAIVANKNEMGKLELYYAHYHAGLIHGKMVVQAAVDATKLALWKKNAVKVSYMPSGKAQKYLLDSTSLPTILQSIVQSITFIPATHLDENIVINRFGKPDRRIHQPGITHFLYPAKGLDVALYEKAKDVLQYVKPADFKYLEKPLE